MVNQFKPTEGQRNALMAIRKFVHDDTFKAFILKGYAGTGKTTLVREVIETFKKENVPYVLLASTGRAAKILSNATQHTAATIHSQIYSYKDFNQDLYKEIERIERTGVDKSGQLFLQFELIPVETQDHIIYIIDESSMISDVASKDVTQAMFGSGRLLLDLFSYDPNGKFLFVGDVCQLPPIEGKESPALSMKYLTEHHNIQVMVAELTEIVRQADGNDIIDASQEIRKLYAQTPAGLVYPSGARNWGKVPLRHYSHVDLHTDDADLMDCYVDTVQQKGYNEATMLCKTNKKSLELSLQVRKRLGFGNMVQKGDLLLVTQNNYISGLMNGDLVTVVSISNEIKQRAELTFRKVEVKELFTGKVYSQLMIDDIVYGPTPNLTSEQQKGLFIDFAKRMKKSGYNQKSERFRERMMTDEYLNALRCVYGYALTCHKAQGGEWNHVFLSFPRDLTLNMTKASYQWLYTAVTRAKQRLHIVDGFYIEGYMR